MSDMALARRNVFVLTAAQTLGAASPPIIISLGGIIGQMLSTQEALVTLPVSLYHLGLAAGTIPAAMIMRRYGRRNGYLLGASIGLIAGLVATLGIVAGAFIIFCLGTLMAGFYGSYVQSYRFAATDAATGAFKSKAISYVMVGGLAAAVIGPQLVIWTRDLFITAPFAGSFLSQSVLALLAIPVIMMLKTPKVEHHEVKKTANSGRPLSQIISTPRFILAAAAGMVSYALMSFVMTASPMAMVGCGFTVGEAALGIQWHVLSMFAPSFFTGSLIARFGKEMVTAIGLLLVAASAAVALQGLELANFWLSLVLLGVGWNLSFIGATAMITDCYTHEERGKVQGFNDFLIFGTVAVASFSSGSLLSASGWETINIMVFPIVAAVTVPLLFVALRKRHWAR